MTGYSIRIILISKKKKEVWNLGSTSVLSSQPYCVQHVSTFLNALGEFELKTFIDAGILVEIVPF